MATALKALGAVCAAAASAATLAGAAPALAFSPPEGDFTADFASPPQVAAQGPRSRDDAGHRSYQLSDGARLFEVTVDAYPASIPTPPPDAQSCLLLLNAHARQTGWRLVKTEKAEVAAGTVAVQGRLEADDGRVELMRVVMAGRDIYQVRAVAQSGDDLGSAVAFVGSFTVRPTLARR